MPYMPLMTTWEEELLASVEEELECELPANRLLVSLGISTRWPLSEQCQRNLDGLAALMRFDIRVTIQENEIEHPFARVVFTNQRPLL